MQRYYSAMEAIQNSLNTLFTSDAWPGIVLGLRIGMVIVVVRLLYLVLRHSRKGTKNARSGLIPAQFVLFVPFLVLFVATLGYQASWQLFGRSRPKFVQFMQKYDRRQFNPAHSITRGKIVDRKERVIAYSLKKGKDVERKYRLGPMFAHLVGYSDPKYGMTGLENAAHTHLIGGGLDSLKEWQDLGRTIVDRSEVTPGQDLTLTVDIDLQKVAYDALKGKKGAAVLMNVTDGSILTLVSAPAFDPNNIDRELRFAGQDSDVLLNRVTQGLYPPGSTFKVVLAAAAFKQNFTSNIDCPADGYTTSPKYPKICDHEYYNARENGTTWAGHGSINTSEALVKSSNVYFSKLGVLLGRTAVQEASEDFGINDSIYIFSAQGDALYVTPSRYPDLAENDKYGLAQVSIGQGKLVVTPMQMCLVAAAIANHGVLMQPKLQLEKAPTKLKRCMNEQHAKLLSVMMRKVVGQGTARGMANVGFSSAGKTGTAQNPHGNSHGWYIGFAPYESPKVAVCVLVENGGYGSGSALPIARELLVKASHLGYLE